MKIALLISALLFLGATLLLLSGLLDQHRRARQVAQRLDGKPLSDHRVRHWLQVLGDSRIGQRSVKLDNETQTLLNRLGWRSARQRSLFAACQIGIPVLALALSLLIQSVFFSQVNNHWITPAFATALGYLLPKRLLAAAAYHRQKQLAIEISTFIPLLRILFESGMAVEQSLRVLSIEGKQLLPALTHELRLILTRVDSGLELGEVEVAVLEAPYRRAVRKIVIFRRNLDIRRWPALELRLLHHGIVETRLAAGAHVPEDGALESRVTEICFSNIETIEDHGVEDGAPGLGAA